MKRTWTIIGVRDVARSFEWYQSLFGQPLTRPAHDDFGQLCDTDGTVLLCLHQWGAHEHPSLMSPERGKPPICRHVEGRSTLRQFARIEKGNDVADVECTFFNSNFRRH